MSEILILVEGLEGLPDKKTLELFRAGTELARDLEAEVSAVVVGEKIADLAAAAAGYGLKKVYQLEHPLLKGFQPEAWVGALEWLCREIKPRILLISHSFIGKEVAPRLAFRLQTELTTDCLGLGVDPQDGLMIRTKPIYGGNAIATLKGAGSPQMATIRKNIYEPLEAGGPASEIVALAPPLEESALRVKSLKTVPEEVVELDKANMVISGGRGIAEKEDFELLEALARALGKTHGKVLIGCSRPVVDKCWLSSDRQVGLTGSIIAPDAYLAIGISGAIQHLVGMIRSKKIIAINTDAGCNMFKVADYGVVEDYKELLPALVKKLEE
ncbi:MAG: electron transfer flavoprotein subunit alpha/FixB family protein [Deltaproteobacteria bacterium]|nr:electron transfer flavoprotein subunit alpha/FixB family protein [Deltaproteobacteria bacterium]